MRPARLAKEIVAALRRHGKRTRREATLSYFPSSMENMGVAAPDLRKVVRRYKSDLKAEAPADVLELALAIVSLGTLEGRHAAYELVAGKKNPRKR